MNKIYTRMDAGTNQQFHAKKSLGQNFLVNRVVIDRIINASHLEPQDIVIEIGPGQGVLTQRIAPRVEKVFAIEKDRFLIEKLNADFNGSNVEIVHGDFLEFDLSAFDRPVKIVGNVPYNISTPIITKILENRRYISRAYFTLQLEFADIPQRLLQ